MRARLLALPKKPGHGGTLWAEYGQNSGMGRVQDYLLISIHPVFPVAVQLPFGQYSSLNTG